MPCAVYPCMAQWSLIIGAALGQTSTGNANQTGQAVAFGKAEAPLMCTANELHGQLNHSQGKSCLSTKGHGYDLSVILCQYVFLTKYHIKSPLHGPQGCLHAQGWERKSLSRPRKMHRLTPCDYSPSLSLPFVYSSPNSCAGAISGTGSLGSHKTSFVKTFTDGSTVNIVKAQSRWEVGRRKP